MIEENLKRRKIFLAANMYSIVNELLKEDKIDIQLWFLVYNLYHKISFYEHFMIDLSCQPWTASSSTFNND